MAHLWAWFMANCWGNIVASGITTTLGLWWHHRRISAKHKAELRKLRIELLGTVGEVRDHLLGAIERQGGDR